MSSDRRAKPIREDEWASSHFPAARRYANRSATSCGFNSFSSPTGISDSVVARNRCEVRAEDHVLAPSARRSVMLVGVSATTIPVNTRSSAVPT